MSDCSKSRAVISGAGTVGVIAAIVLAQQGWTVQVSEPHLSALPACVAVTCSTVRTGQVTSGPRFFILATSFTICASNLGV